MNLLCPSCQKMLQVPEQFAGQMMKCPLCAGTFTVPSPAGAAPAAAAAPFSATPASGNTAASAAAAPAAPPAGYQSSHSVTLNPTFLGWLPALALLLVFFLMFFPWFQAGISAGDERGAVSGWQTGLFGDKGSGLGMLYALLFLLTLIASIGSAVVSALPASSLPPAVQQFLPWRASAVAIACLVTLLVLMVHTVAGLSQEAREALIPSSQFSVYFEHTVFERLAIFCHLLAVAGAGLDAWVAGRGPSKPLPRIDINW